MTSETLFGLGLGTVLPVAKGEYARWGLGSQSGILILVFLSWSSSWSQSFIVLYSSSLLLGSSSQSQSCILLL